MGERHELPKIKPTEQPSILNANAASGAFWGQLIANIPTLFIKSGSASKAVLATGTVIGAVWGGLSGKAQQEKEMIQGRVVKDPGYWNKGLMGGLAFGGLALTIPYVGLPIAIASTVTGCIIRKNSLQKDFDQSLAIHEQQQAHIAQAMMMGKGKQQNYMNSVTPTESATLAQQFAAQNNHAQAVIQQAAAPEAAAAR